MKILSLFDGMSCGQLALQKLGITDYEYYASEIDKFAMQVTQNNFPNTIQIGDVTKIKGEDYKDIYLIQGGSPCQGFSFAGKQLNFEDPRSKLFFEFVRLVNEVKPKYFMLENVKMKKEYQDVITEHLFGVEPTLIDSARLSAQSRKRLYWLGELQEDGTYKQVKIEQPQDRGILLKDILEEEVDEKFYVSDETYEKLKRFESNSRLSPLDGKSYCLNTMQGGHRQPKILNRPHGYFKGSIHTEKSPTIRSQVQGNILKQEEFRIRKITPIECERLQTVPDNYTSSVSNSQRYKMLGNGWTVDVIAHIFKDLLPKK